MLVRRVCCTQSRIVGRSITDARQRTITQQVRYVAHIARMYLLVSVGNSGILLCRVFQLEDAEGYAVYIEQNIGDTHLISQSVTDFQLVYNSESILFGKVNKFDVKFGAVAIASIAEAVAHKYKCIAQTLKMRLTRHMAQSRDDFVGILRCQICVTVEQRRFQFINKKRFAHWPMNGFAIGILPALRLQ